MTDFEPRYHRELWVEFHAAFVEPGAEEKWAIVIQKIADLPKSELTVFVTEVAMAPPPSVHRDNVFFRLGCLAGGLSNLEMEAEKNVQRKN